MSDLNKESIEVLEATMQFMENKIRQLQKKNDRTTDEQSELENLNRIRGNIWQLKQINPAFYYVRAKQNILENPASNTLVEDINALIQNYTEDIKKCYESSMEIEFPEGVQFKTTRLNREERELDDTVNVAFFITSFCSREEVLTQSVTEKGFLEKSPNVLAPYIQPSPSLKWKILGMTLLSLISFFNPIASAVLAAAVCVYYRKEIYHAITGARDSSSVIKKRETISASEEEIRLHHEMQKKNQKN